MNQYFSLSDKVYTVTEQYPVLIRVLAAQGFAQLENPMLRRTLGKTLSLENAIKSRGLDPEQVEKSLVEAIEKEKNHPDLTVAGVLPCPIRLQLMEKLEAWAENQPEKIDFQLQAASMGLDWLREGMGDGTDFHRLADVYLSAGFSLFFDRKVMGAAMEAGVYQDMSPLQEINPLFTRNGLDIKDPRGQFTILGAVPAIFMVNTAALGDRPFPTRWTDLMMPAFENTVALPMKDLDLFNAVLLGIDKTYGEEGVRKLGKALLSSMHPAQMIKDAKKAGTPVVTVMPYFFSFMAKEQDPLKAVWPEDGAILSPIFLLTKKERQDKVQGLVNFLLSEEMGRVLSADGKFPSVHPHTENGIPLSNRFIWPGWTYLYSQNVAERLAQTEEIFLQAKEG